MRRKGIRAVAIGVLAPCALSGCVTGSGWFGEPTKVAEVGRAVACGTAGAEARLQLFTDTGAVRLWERSHGVRLNTGFLDAGRYALVEMGRHSTGGYGIAVSSEARRSGSTLELNATFFTPAPDAMVTQMLTSPCVLVRLPVGDYSQLRLLDQDGRARAELDLSAAVPTEPVSAPASEADQPEAVAQ